MLRTALSLLAVFGLVATALAAASDHTVTEKGKKFSEKKLTIQAGDSITFVNDDNITHNVYSKKVNEFDTGAQKPGASNTIVFKNKGKQKVRCAIHPKMKMTVVVE